MREKLKERDGIRGKYRGVFKRYGLKSSYRGWPRITLLVVDVETLVGEAMADHIWLNETKALRKLGPLHPGDVIAFDARVKPYEKGYVNEGEEIDEREIDYKLSHPTAVAIIKFGPRGEYRVCPRCGYYNGLSSEMCRRCYVDLVEPAPSIKQVESPMKQLEQKSLLSWG